MMTATLYGTICDSCSQAGYEEAAGLGLDDLDIAATVLLEMGADIADHLCDETESEGEIRCECACRRRGAS